MNKHVNVRQNARTPALVVGLVSMLSLGMVAHAGLVAYYDFEDDVLDSSSEGNNGTVVGTATYSTDVPAALSSSTKSFYFDHLTYIQSGSALSFPDEQMSLSFWIKSSATTYNFEKVLGNRLNSGGGFQVERRGTTNNGRIAVNGDNLVTVDNLPSAMNQNWHHVAIAVDNGTVTTWVDGEKKYDLSYDALTKTIQSAEKFTIGARAVDYDVGTRLLGYLDDVAVWDGVLSQAHVTALYGGASPASISLGIALSNSSVSSNAAPGTLVGTLSYADADDFDVVVTGTGPDSGDFEVTSSTNLRTKVWMDAATKDISIVAYSNSTAILTNDFTITVDAASGAGPVFVVSADVENGADDGTVVGTAETIQSGATFSVSGGRTDLFFFDGNDLKVSNSANWGGVGTTNYVTLQAVADSITNKLVVAVGVVSNTPQASVFRFR